MSEEDRTAQAVEYCRSDVTVHQKALPGFNGDAWLVKLAGEYFVVSMTAAPFSGMETLAFPATSTGEVTDWCELAGGRGVDHETAISELVDRKNAMYRAPAATRYLLVPDEAHHLFALRPGGVVEHFDLCHQVWHPAPAEVLKDIAETFGDMTEVAYSDLPAVAQ